MVKNPKFTNLFVVSITEFLMMFLSLKLMRPIRGLCAGFCSSAAVLGIISLGLFVIPIIICLLYMWLTYPDKLRIFIAGGAGRSLKTLGIGLALGLVMNALLCILAMVSGSVTYSFIGFNPLLLVAIPFCFIQCASEEVLLRGYASSYLEDNYSYEVVAFVCGVLFIAHHIGNMKAYGFSFVFCLSIFLLGTLEYLSVKLSKSIWCAFGFHTAWNYTQSYFFGSENSGMESTLALFSSSDAKDSFFCNTVYGNEGTWMCVILVLIATIIAYMMFRKEAAPSR